MRGLPITIRRLPITIRALPLLAALLVACLAAGVWVSGCGETDPVGSYTLLSTDDIIDRATLTLHEDGTFTYEQHQVADGQTTRGAGKWKQKGDGLELSDDQITYSGELNGDRLTIRFEFEGVKLRQEWEKQ